MHRTAAAAPPPALPMFVQGQHTLREKTIEMSIEQRKIYGNVKILYDDLCFQLNSELVSFLVFFSLKNNINHKNGAVRTMLIKSSTWLTHQSVYFTCESNHANNIIEENRHPWLRDVEHSMHLYYIDISALVADSKFMASKICFN